MSAQAERSQAAAFVVNGPRSKLEREDARRHGSPTCKAQGCRESTRERKPYCLEHIGNLPAVKAVLAEIEARNQELAVVGKNPKAARADSPHAADIHNLLLTKGPLSSSRLARMLCIKAPTVLAYAEAMRKARPSLIKIVQGGRGQAILVPLGGRG